LPPFTSVSQGVWSDRYGQDTQFWRSPEPYTRTPAEQASNNGTDTLTNIERVKFADGGIAFLDDANSKLVSGLLKTVFGAPALSNKLYAGIGLSLADSGMNMSDLSTLAVKAKFGENYDVSTAVKGMWMNVVGTAATDAQVAPFVDAFRSGALKMGDVVTGVALSPDLQYSAELVGVKAVGLAFAYI